MNASAILEGVAAASPSVVAWDTETWRIAPGRLAPPLVCHSFAWREPGGRLASALVDRPTGLEVLRGLLDLEAPPVTLVAHNAAFDLAVAWAADASLSADLWRALDDGRVSCSKVREHLLQVAAGNANRAAPPTSLAACVSRYLAEDVSGKSGEDAWRLRYHELDGVPIVDWPEAARSYAELDARYCLRVYEAQSRAALALLGSEAVPDEAPQVRAAFALHLTACWGLRTESTRVAKYASDLRRRVDRAEEVLGVYGLVVDGVAKKLPRSEAVVRAYAEHGLGDPPLTEKGEELLRDPDNGLDREDLVPKYVSAAGDVLRELPCAEGECEDGLPCGELLHILADREDANRELTRYVKHLDRGTIEVLNPRISPVKSTGRASAAKPPYQQFPRRPGARECVVPREGCVFVGADYSANELVTLAQVLIEVVGHSALAEVLREGLDPHLRTGAAILGIGYEEAARRLAAKDPVVKDARQLSKALNFGLPGGMGPKAFAEYAWSDWGVKIPVDRVRELKARWLDLYPEVRDYFAAVSARCDAGGGSFDLVQPYSGRLRGSVKYCDGCNSPFQGLAADATKAALYRACRESWVPASPPSPLLRARPVLFMHDEIIAEAREARAPEAAERLAVVMVEELALRCPDVAEACRAEPWVARRWSKDVEPVRDAGGRLIPWDDR